MFPEWIDLLSKEDRVFVGLRFRGATLDEIARALHRGRTWVRRRLKQIQYRVAEMIGEMDLLDDCLPTIDVEADLGEHHAADGRQS